MKIGIRADTLDVGSYGRWGELTYKKLRELGFECSDYNMMSTETVIYEAEEKETEKILAHEKELAEDAGIEIFQAHGPWCWPLRDKTSEGRKERMEKMQRSIRMASYLGCKNWVIHPIMPFGTSDLLNGNAENTWELNIEFMSQLVEYAKEYDVTVCLENMPMLDFSISKPEDILKLVKEIDDEYFKICFDTGHAAVFNELNPAEEIKRLGDEIRTLHIHDNKENRDLHLLPYFGIIDWRSIVDALNEINFTGSFSLEAVPPRKVSDDLFEDISRLTVKIVDKIISG